MEPIFETYPHFEPNQVLSSRHLNDLRDFLDRQNRYTRSKLIGTGIVSGFSFSVNDTAIILQNGVGVTSQGFLINNMQGDIVEDGAAEEFQAFSHVRIVNNYDPFKSITNVLNASYVELKSKAQAIQDGLDEDDPFPVGNIPEGEIPDAPVMWELFTTEQADGDTTGMELLTDQESEFLAGKVLLVYQEQVVTELKSCFSNTCDDKGSERSYRLRYLLLREFDAQILFHKEYPVDVLDPYRTPLLPGLKLPQYRFPNPIPNTEAIFQSFRQLLSNYLPTLRQTLEDMYRVVWSLGTTHLGASYGTNPITEAFDAANWSADGFNGDVYTTHHVYDLVRVLTTAYMEIRLKLYDMLTNQAQYFHRQFSDFIMVGQTTAFLPEEANPGNLLGRALHYNFRHHFQSARQESTTNHHRDELLSMFGRITALIRQADQPLFEQEVNPNNNPVRLTPTMAHDEALGEQSLPFYLSFSDQVRALWNAEATREQRAHQLLSFHGGDYNPGDDYVSNPIAFQHSEYPWYRVEGYWRQYLVATTDRIKQAIQDFHLPFHLQPLTVGGRALNLQERETYYNSPEYRRYEERYLETRMALRQHLLNLLRYFRFDDETLQKAANYEDKYVATYKEAQLENDPLIGRNNLPDPVQQQLKSLEEMTSKLLDYVNEPCLQDFDFSTFRDVYSQWLDLLVKYIMIHNRSLVTLVSAYMAADSKTNFNFPSNALNQFMRALQNLLLDPVLIRDLQWLRIHHHQFTEAINSLRVEDLETFLQNNPGPTHIGGVSKGGTLLLIYETVAGRNEIVADFYVPYCCTHQPGLSLPSCADIEKSINKLGTIGPIAHPEFAYTYPGKPTIIQLLTADATLTSQSVKVEDLKQVTLVPFDDSVANKDDHKFELLELVEGRLDLKYTPPKEYTGFVMWKFRLVNPSTGARDTNTVYILVGAPEVESTTELTANPFTVSFNSRGDRDFIEVINSGRVGFDPEAGVVTLDFDDANASGGKLVLPSGNIVTLGTTGFYFAKNAVTGSGVFDTIRYKVSQGADSITEAMSLISVEILQQQIFAGSFTINQMSYAGTRVRTIDLSGGETIVDPKANLPIYTLLGGDGKTITFSNGNEVTLSGSMLTITINSQEEATHVVNYSLEQGPDNQLDNGSVTINAVSSNNPIVAYDGTQNLVIPQATAITIDVLALSTISDGPAEVEIVQGLNSELGNELTTDGNGKFTYTIKNYGATSDAFRYRITQGPYSDEGDVTFAVAWDTVYKPVAIVQSQTQSYWNLPIANGKRYFEFNPLTGADIVDLFGVASVNLRTTQFSNGNTVQKLSDGRVRYIINDDFSDANNSILYYIQQINARNSSSAPAYVSDDASLNVTLKLNPASVTPASQNFTVYPSTSSGALLGSPSTFRDYSRLRIGLQVNNGALVETDVVGASLTRTTPKGGKVTLQKTTKALSLSFEGDLPGVNPDSVRVHIQNVGEQKTSTVFQFTTSVQVRATYNTTFDYASQGMNSYMDVYTDAQFKQSANYALAVVSGQEEIGRTTTADGYTRVNYRSDRPEFVGIISLYFAPGKLPYVSYGLLIRNDATISGMVEKFAVELAQNGATDRTNFNIDIPPYNGGGGGVIIDNPKDPNDPILQYREQLLKEPTASLDTSKLTYTTFNKL